MNPSELESSFLLKQFHTFYEQVVRQKTKIAEIERGTADLSNAELESFESDRVHTVQITLIKVLEEQVLESRRHGGEYGVDYYKKAQYVMAALADEVFLNLHWEGREIWKSNLLEFKFFGTHVAGELLFKKIEELLKDRDPALIEIAAIYLMALSLGFRGKFKDKDDAGMLDYYRSQLFTFIFKTNADLSSETKQLFPETYNYTLDKSEGKRLPYLNKWIAVILFITVLFLVGSHAVWDHQTKDLVTIAEEIIRGAYSAN
jgi:type VI secretion system protein ImpK